MMGTNLESFCLDSRIDSDNNAFLDYRIILKGQVSFSRNDKNETYKCENNPNGTSFTLDGGENGCELIINIRGSMTFSRFIDSKENIKNEILDSTDQFLDHLNDSDDHDDYVETTDVVVKDNVRSNVLKRRAFKNEKISNKKQTKKDSKLSFTKYKRKKYTEDPFADLRDTNNSQQKDLKLTESKNVKPYTYKPMKHPTLTKLLLHNQTSSMMQRRRCRKMQKKLSKIKCEVCGFSCFQERTIAKHLLTHIQGNAVKMKQYSFPFRNESTDRFFCVVCNLCTKTALGMLKHLAKFHYDCEKWFACSFCEFGTTSLNELHTHVKNNHLDENSKFFCSECDEKFDSIESFEDHSKQHISNTMFCKLCYKKISSNNKMKEHVIENHLKLRNPMFSCGECKYSTTDFRGLQDHHFRKHSNERLFLCSECGHSFKTKMCLRQHQLLHGEDKYFCSECPYSCKTGAAMNFHRKLKHSTERPFLCDACPYAGKTRGDLKQHAAQVHSDFRPYKCPDCDFAAKTTTILKTHCKNIHTDARPFVCSVCGYACKSKDLLERHTIRKHSLEKPYSCELCSYNSKMLRDLKLHMERKHNANKVRNFKCDQCNYCTDVKGSLKEHMLRRHTNERPWPCSKCTYTAKTKRGLQAHIKEMHVERKPFFCNICDHMCKSRTGIAFHKKTKHGITGQSKRFSPPNHVKDMAPPVHLQHVSPVIHTVDNKQWLGHAKHIANYETLKYERVHSL